MAANIHRGMSLLRFAWGLLNHSIGRLIHDNGSVMSAPSALANTLRVFSTLAVAMLALQRSQASRLVRRWVSSLHRQRRYRRYPLQAAAGLQNQLGRPIASFHMSADAHEPTDIKDAVRETDQGHERSEQDVRAVRFCRGMWASVARPTQDSRFRPQLVDAMQ